MFWLLKRGLVSDKEKVTLPREVFKLLHPGRLQLVSGAGPVCPPPTSGLS